MFYQRIALTVHGQSAHGSQPHLGRDAIVAASNIVLNCQLLASRLDDPLQPATLTFTKVRAGSQFNIITDSVELSGVLGFAAPEQGAGLRAQLQNIAEHAAAALGCTVDAAYGDTTDEPTEAHHGN